MPRTPARPPVSVHNVVGVAVGVGALLGAAALARRTPTQTEARLFRAANDLPGLVYPAVWIPMQYGTFATVPATAARRCADPGSRWRSPEAGAHEDAPRERMLRAEDVALVALFLATLPEHVVLDEVLMLPRGLIVDPW
jgi:hypothetical protein